MGHLQVFGEHFDALNARFFTRLLSDNYPIKPRSAEQIFEQKGDRFLKTWLKLQLLLEEIRTRRQQARLRERVAEWEAHLALQALTLPDLKALDQCTACCGPLPIHSRKET